MSRILKSYNQAHTLSQNSFNVSIALFEKCARLVDAIKIDIVEKNYYSRYKNTERIIVLLNAFSSTLDHTNENAEDCVDHLRYLCTIFMNELTTINQTQSIEHCDHLKQAFLDMSKLWHMAENDFKRLSQNKQPQEKDVGSI